MQRLLLVVLVFKPSLGKLNSSGGGVTLQRLSSATREKKTGYERAISQKRPIEKKPADFGAEIATGGGKL